MGDLKLEGLRVFLVHGDLAEQMAGQMSDGAGANLKQVLAEINRLKEEGVMVVNLSGVGGMGRIKVRRGEKIVLAGAERDICREEIGKELRRRGAVVIDSNELTWEDL